MTIKLNQQELKMITFMKEGYIDNIILTKVNCACHFAIYAYVLFKMHC